MEGASIAHGAYLNGLPFVIIRAISDKADDSAEMDYPTFEAAATWILDIVVMQLLTAAGINLVAASVISAVLVGRSILTSVSCSAGWSAETSSSPAKR